MSGNHSGKRGPIAFLFENSAFLIAGAIAALIWANVDKESYESFVHHELWGGHHEEAAPATGGEGATGAETPGDAPEKEEGGGGHAHNTIAFIVNDIFMAFFFAIAGKEVWESLLPGGSLSSPKKAAVPLLATAGGMLGPVAVYMTGVWLVDQSELSSGWAIPCATDIAFSYMVARIIFGPGHPAIAFLLLLAIADDAAGLVILAIFYPSAPVEPQWLLLTVGAIATGFLFRKLKIKSFWPYLIIPGAMSWFSFYSAHLHPALGLVPIIPTLPHAHTDLGIFVKAELGRHDTLNEFEHWWKNPVEIFLGFFGLCNAGVAFSSVGNATHLVLAGLLLGKPIGITLFTFVSQKVMRLQLPQGMGYREIITVGFIAAIGFTVSLFVSVAAFPLSGPRAVSQEVLDAAKMGALLSFSAVFISIIFAKVVGVKPYRDDGSPPADTEKPPTNHQNEEAVAS